MNIEQISCCSAMPYLMTYYMHLDIFYSLMTTPKVSMASTQIFSDSLIRILLRSYRCAKTAIIGCGHFQAFRPGFSIWHICHVVRHGHFTPKQLRLSVLNEMYTNSYTGPRLMMLLLYPLMPELLVKRIIICLVPLSACLIDLSRR